MKMNEMQQLHSKELAEIKQILLMMQKSSNIPTSSPSTTVSVEVRGEEEATRPNKRKTKPSPVKDGDSHPVSTMPPRRIDLESMRDDDSDPPPQQQDETSL